MNNEITNYRGNERKGSFEGLESKWRTWGGGGMRGVYMQVGEG